MKLFITHSRQQIFLQPTCIFSVLALIVFFFSLILMPQTIAESHSVRLAVTASSGSGIEQQIADYINAQFSQDPNVVISTVNPDWNVECKAADSADRFTGQIHCNGTVTVKTPDGQIISTISSQSYNQDYSTQLGEPNNRQGAPLNKALVQSATKEVVSDLGQRATDKIREAVQVELQARNYISQAEALANSDKYDDAISMLGNVTQDSVHFQSTQKRIEQFQMEKQALELVSNAQAKAKKGRYSEAITLLKDVDLKSKRHKQAIQLTSEYKRQLALAHARLKHLTENKINRVRANTATIMPPTR